MIVIKIIRKSEKCSRVLLEDGRQVKIPTSLILEDGITSIPEQDIISIENNYMKDFIHVSLKPVEKKTRESS